LKSAGARRDNRSLLRRVAYQAPGDARPASRPS